MDGPELRRHRLRLAVSAGALIVLALASGVAWRAEVEWRGWHGLDWIDSPHAAFPLAMAAFVVWAALVTRFVHRLSALRLAALGLALAAIGVAAWFVIPQILLYAFGGWLGGGLLSMEVASSPQRIDSIRDYLQHGGNVNGVLLRDLVFWSVWLSPTVALWIALRAAGVRSRLWSLPLSGMVQFWSWPVAMWLLAIVGHKGGSDPAHALKSGFVIPGLVAAAGIPFLAVRNPD